MENLLNNLNNKLNSNFNLIKIQQYTNGKSGIGRHSDKTLDMDPESNIVILRINKDIEKTRCIIFKDKTTGLEQIYNMKSNSVLIITPDENKKMVHYVPENEHGASDECVSFVFRTIKTYMNPITNIKYGIGAKYQTYEERIAHSDEKPIDSSEITNYIVSMYNYENTHDLTINNDLVYFNTVKCLTL
jgi:hypothetical protein